MALSLLPQWLSELNCFVVGNCPFKKTEKETVYDFVCLCFSFKLGKLRDQVDHYEEGQIV